MTVDLSTRYLGLELRSPLVVSANPLTREPESVDKFEIRGAYALSISDGDREVAVELDAPLFGGEPCPVLQHDRIFP